MIKKKKAIGFVASAFKLKSLLILIGICIILYVGYIAVSDFKAFISNPFKELFNFKSETKIETEVLQQKLLKNSKYIFAEEDLRLSYKFYRKIGLAWIKATFEWDTKTDIGITNEDIKIAQVQNELIVSILNIRVFEINNLKEDVKDKGKSTWPADWKDDSTPYIAFNQDRAHVAYEKLQPILIMEKEKVYDFAKNSIADFLKPFVKEVSNNLVIKVVIDPNCNFIFTEPKGEISSYYSEQKKEELNHSISKKQL